MGIKRFRPTTPSLRFKAISNFSEVTKSSPEKSLLAPLKKTGGRNNNGRVTMRHRGGGSKRKYRLIDFRRDKFDVEGRVIAIEYDPNRSARIALVEYPDKERRYIIWPDKLKVGDSVTSASNAQIDIRPGNTMRLEHMPMGTFVHNIELIPGKGGILVRSAGSWAQLMAKEKGFAQLRMPSSEIRMIKLECLATVGQVGLIEHSSFVHGKAGRLRWLGRRSKVRGVAMNPIDHPHGGGEGKAGQGNPHPVTPWGKPTKGAKTRKPKKIGSKHIIKRRSKK
ncbi:MAG: 50S ribosomal protein L2 [Candidatus Omnitrophica bacterium]|nr:50S ribosomal protein L2 [Candidatus Omnitrophota bacterium]MDD5429159.1 50S ribosomal protein L2 [Candidatus Omnitrophota bacterium]